MNFMFPKWRTRDSLTREHIVFDNDSTIYQKAPINFVSKKGKIFNPKTLEKFMQWKVFNSEILTNFISIKLKNVS